MAKSIHNAAGYGNPKEVERFLKKGVPIDDEDDHGRSPLCLAATYGHLNVVEFLLPLGASVSHRASTGRTPLHFAAVSGYVEIVQRLLTAGTDIEAADDDGETPLMAAATHVCQDAARLLLENGADINARDTYGFTPLVHAMLINTGPYSRRLALIRELLEAGADPTIQSTDGQTAVDICEETGRDAELLAELQKAAGVEATAEKWEMIGGPECVLCRQLARWKPSKSHPDYIKPDLVAEWLGVSLPGRVADGEGTFYRGSQLVKLEILQTWHAELCENAG
ncbi:MAG: ankyrin repeat domain-containing protein [Planctomycetes bacterium]|nr:ankyrin repeat domain-containing protein [Planctomycetota bacterium]